MFASTPSTAGSGCSATPCAANSAAPSHFPKSGSPKSSSKEIAGLLAMGLFAGLVGLTGCSTATGTATGTELSTAEAATNGVFYYWAHEQANQGDSPFFSTSSGDTAGAADYAGDATDRETSESSEQSGLTSTHLDLSNDLLIWAPEGAELEKTTLAALAKITGHEITQQVVSVAELAAAAQAIATGGMVEIAEGSDLETPDLLIGLDETTLDETAVSGEVTAVEYGVDYACVLALREYYSANQLAQPASWNAVTAAAALLQIADPTADANSRAFALGLTISLDDDDLWADLAGSGATLVDEYPSFAVSLGIDGAPDLAEATASVLTQPILRVGSALDAVTSANNLGTDQALAVVAGTCVQRSLFALVVTDEAAVLAEYLATTDGQTLLATYGDAYPIDETVTETVGLAVPSVVASLPDASGDQADQTSSALVAEFD